MPQIQHDLALCVHQAIKKAQKKGELPKFEIPTVIIERPKSSERGDYACAVCMNMARFARMAPMEIARLVAKRFPETDYISEINIANPGFINFTLDHGWLQQQVRAILDDVIGYTSIELGKGKSVQVEYGSANPTGPLHMGFGRNVVLGDGIANVLAAAGYKVHREYYVNDSGTQMTLFASSLYARYAQARGINEPVPEDGYQGDYLVEWGKDIAHDYNHRFVEMPRELALEEIRQIGLNKVLDSVRTDCHDLGIHYDNWFHEKTLYQNGQFEKIMTILREREMLEEKDGAIWFTASKYDAEVSDQVVIRSNGLPGYFASDIAYHYNKFVERGFDWVIDVWGADHQGHVPRMKAMMQSLGLDTDRLTLALYQLVTIKQGGEDIRLSKRAGTMVSLREILEEVGADAIRYTLLTRAAESQMDFDIDLAKEQSDRNPVYYVQYAHARIASILREADERGFSSEDGQLTLLSQKAELDLIRKMIELSEVIEKAAIHLAPHHLAYYAQELATIFNIFYRDCRVLPRKDGDSGVTEKETSARLLLVQAAKASLARTLFLMGMNAPERM